MNARIVGSVTTYLTDRTTSLIDVFDPGSYKGGGKDSTVRIGGLLLGNQAFVDATKWAISKALDLAAQSQRNRTVNKVYLEVDTGNGVWKRTEITGGELRADTQHYDRLTRDHVPFELYISRKPWWEGAEVAIPLSNLNGTNNTAGLNVYNANDLAGTSPSRRCNYADIAAGVVVGDMPSPIKLTGKNLFAGYGDNRDNLGSLWVGLGRTNPTTLKHVIESESSLGGAEANGTNVAHATASGGAYRTLTISPSAINTYDTIGAYALTAADLSGFAGQRVRVLLRAAWLGGLYADLQFRLRVNAFSWTGDWVTPNAAESLSIREMFDVRMPPFLEGLESLAGATLYLDVRNPSALAQTVTLDDLLLFPTDGWAEFMSSIPTNSQFVLDGTEGRAYASDGAGANRFALRNVISTNMELQPGEAHRLYFAQHTIYLNSWSINQLLSVKASYRPRWATL